MRELRGHDQPVLTLAFAPDGRTLASGDGGGAVRLWNLASGNGVEIDDVPGIESPGGRWRDRAGFGRGPFPPRDTVLSLAWSPLSHSLAVGLSRDVVIYDFSRGLRWHYGLGLGGSTVVAFYRRPGVLEFACTGYLDHEIHLRDLEKKHSGGSLIPSRGGVLALAGSPTDPRLASAGGLPGAPELLVWNMESEDLRAALVGHTRPVYAVAFSPDGRQLVSGSRDGTVRLWDLDTATGRILFTGPGTIVSVAFRPDGQSVLAADDKGRIVLLDARSGARLAAYDWRIGTVRCVAFAPDGLTAAAAGRDRTVLVWDVD